jgi:transposase
MYNSAIQIKEIDVLKITTQLPDSIKECHEMIAEKGSLITELRSLLSYYKHKTYGQSSERSDSIEDRIKAQIAQLNTSDGFYQSTIFDDLIGEYEGLLKENEQLIDDDKDEKPAKKSRRGIKKKSKTMRLDELEANKTLEVKDYHCGQDITECPDCLSEDIMEIGTEETRQLEIEQPRLYIKRTINHKYKCTCCENLSRGQREMAPIEKCLAGPELLTHILYSRFRHYTTYYRLKNDFLTQGVEISETNMCNWINTLAEDVFAPIYKLIGQRISSSDIVYADETTQKELAKKKCKTKYIWAYINPNDGLVYFEYSDRKKENPTAFLKEFLKGYLVTDKYSGYDEICNLNEIYRCYCWEHAKRKFTDLIDPEGPPEDGLVIKLIITKINNMLHADKELRKLSLPNELFLEEREKKIKPMILEIFESMSTVKGGILLLPKSRLIKAIDYTLNAKVEFQNFLKHPDADATNNLSERTIRFFTIGRKNWLFAGSSRGGKATAIICSVIASAQANGLNVREYILHILKNLPAAKQSELEDFLPNNCKQFKLNPPVKQ